MSGGPPTSGYNPETTVFNGGDQVPIEPYQGGGGLSVAGLLQGASQMMAASSGTPAAATAAVTSPLDTTPIQNLPMTLRPNVIAAATTAATTAAQAGATPEVASAAGVYAGIKQATTESNKANISNTNLSDEDSKLLATAREEEKAISTAAGTAAYNAAIASGATAQAAAQAQVNASVQAIKNYRKTNPYDDQTISLKYTQSQANAILATKDPKAQEVGQAAYNTAFAAAKAQKKSDADAAEIATLAKIEAIDNYTKTPTTAKKTDLTLLKQDEAEKIFATATEDEKVLGGDAATKAVLDAQKRGIRDKTELEKIGIIAAAERIDESRAQRKTSVLSKRVINKSSSSSVIKAVETLPLYLEYSQVEKNLHSTYADLFKKRQAEAEVGQNFQLVMKQRMAQYELKQRSLWLQQIPGATNAPTLPQTKGQITYNPGEVITSFSRLTYVLPITVSDIIVLPPMNGNVVNFLQALQTLDTMGLITPDLKIKENVIIVCVAPFYSIGSTVKAEQIIKNTVLLSFVLDIIAKNPGQWVTLAENTSESYLIGSTFAGRTSTDPIINMFEPSYVLYPYRRKGLEGILISSSLGTGPVLPKDAANKISLEKHVYGSKTFGKAQYIAYKPDLRGEAGAGYFSVIGSLNPLKVPKENIGSCGLANYSLPELIPTLHPSKQIKLSPGIILGFRLRVEGIYEPICVLEKVAVKETQTKFIGSPEAITSPAEIGQTAPFEIGGKIFQIRRSNKQDKVYANWKNGLYTDSEADLLNTINLKPVIMDKIFPPVYDTNGVLISTSWKEWVANFLSTVTVANKSLKTHRETMIIRNFLDQVRNYFMNNQLKKDLDESDSDDETVKRQHGLLEPDGLDNIEAETYEDIKRVWGDIDVYENTETKEWVASIVLVNKNTHKQMYRTVGIPLAEISTEEKAKIALKEKIAGLKKKYSDWIFIY